ncbi:BTB domain-containing protein [Mycena kentingensis (nom. inval.)]|nr:BTB domain-containing protein [Mycena kentingensis (nom. inval.)]
MSADQRPTKRAREEDNTTTSEITRSPDHWLEDGSIVLQVESTQFRVAKSTLAKHSTVFSDMFSLPLPPEEPHVEGCPVVVLSGDSAGDWTHLLNAMHPNGFYIAHPPLAELRSVLRLSKKYDMTRLRQAAVDILRSEAPTDIDELHTVIERGTHYGEVEEIINIARDTGVHSVLPGAFYALAIWTAAHVNDPSPAESPLTVEDQLVCAKGQARLTHVGTKQNLECFGSHDDRIPCSSCTTKAKCTMAAQVVLEVRFSISGLTTASARAWTDLMSHRFCEKCAEAVKTYQNAARTEVWEQLPSFFGLATWEELLRMDLG